MRRSGPIAIAAALWWIAAVPAHARLAIRLGAASGAPGATVSVDVVLATDRGDVSGVANTIAWAAPLRLQGCSANPAIPIVSFVLRPEGCEALQTCSSMRAVALAFGGTLPDGTELYSCAVAIAADAAAGSHPLLCRNAEGGSASAETLAADCRDGTIEVVVPTPTPSPTATAARPSETPTPLVSATATMAPFVCAGDCNGDASVAVDELVTAVRIALGEAAPERCAAADADGDAVVAIAELVRGVANALRGC